MLVNNNRIVNNMPNKIYFFNVQLVDIRLLFHVVAFVHLIITAIVTLSIDTTVDEDDRVKAYIHLRWKLLTCWYNMATLWYLPICVYCGIKEKVGQGNTVLVQRLRYLTDVVMTGIIFPVTVYGDISFWLLINFEDDLLAPAKLFEYMPYWCQHSLHTVSMAVVVLDLLLTPRKRPKSLVPRLLLTTGFSVVYILMVYISYLNGELVYNMFAICSAFQIVLFTILSNILYISFYFIQWKIIEFVWDPQKLAAKFKEKL